jgi:hypothetical protein
MQAIGISVLPIERSRNVGHPFTSNERTIELSPWITGNGSSESGSEAQLIHETVSGNSGNHVAGRVIDNGQTPAYVADQLDVSLADVYEALSYYYAHIDEMRALEAENEAAFADVRDESLNPREPVQ